MRGLSAPVYAYNALWKHRQTEHNEITHSVVTWFETHEIYKPHIKLITAWLIQNHKAKGIVRVLF